MGIFTLTLTQEQIGKNLYLYPNGDLSTCTEFYSVPVGLNYLCVDENYLTPDDDSTYVWWNTPPTALDLYEVQNHTTEAGPINYVQVYARAKSHENSQNIAGIYKIICSPDSTCSHVYRSDNINLTTGYTTYNHVWTENPLTAIAWTWADVDNLCIGAECSSPTTYGVVQSSVFRPNAVGNSNVCQRYTEWVFIGAGNATNYTYVDDELGNTATNLRSWDAVERQDTYNIPNSNPVSQAGIIDSVSIHWKHRDSHTGVPDDAWVRPIVRKGGANYYGNWINNPTKILKAYSYKWTLDPSDAAAWTWADIDGMEIGFGSKDDAMTTHVYAIIKHRENVNPEIRTTQCYAKINYNTVATCDLQSPDWIGTSHTRNIKMLNFWNGTREVYDLNRSGKSMVLTGTEAFSGACAKVVCARNIARNGSTVVITGFSLGYFNGSYKIRSFGWNKISEKPEHYKWIMELEDTEL